MEIFLSTITCGMGIYLRALHFSSNIITYYLNYDIVQQFRIYTTIYYIAEKLDKKKKRIMVRC